MHSLLATATNATFWLPRGVTTVASDVDWLFYFIYWLTIFFFVLILGLMVIFVIKYRHRKGHEHSDPGPSHNNALEITWTVIPTILVGMIFVWGFKGFMDMEVAPSDALEIQVNAKMWNWEFMYPNGHVDNELHLPKDVPVRFVLNSADVIHNFAIPSFRLRKDVVPGRYNKLWAEVSEEGTYPIYCDQYCGTNHSRMRSQVKVESVLAYKAWLEKASNWENTMSPIAAGEMFYKTRGCIQCHTLDGSPGIGPSWKDVFGAQVPLDDGKSVLADEAYIRESVLEPSAKIVAGFKPVMPSFKGSLKDKDIDAIIAFLKSKSSHFKGDIKQFESIQQPSVKTQPGH
jgi:cytochrome c oxidase subunit 2